MWRNKLRFHFLSCTIPFPTVVFAEVFVFDAKIFMASHSAKSTTTIRSDYWPFGSQSHTPALEYTHYFGTHSATASESGVCFLNFDHVGPDLARPFLAVAAAAIFGLCPTESPTQKRPLIVNNFSAFYVYMRCPL